MKGAGDGVHLDRLRREGIALADEVSDTSGLDSQPVSQATEPDGPHEGLAGGGPLTPAAGLLRPIGIENEAPCHPSVGERLQDLAHAFDGCGVDHAVRIEEKEPPPVGLQKGAVVGGRKAQVGSVLQDSHTFLVRVETLPKPGDPVVGGAVVDHEHLHRRRRGKHRADARGEGAPRS